MENKEIFKYVKGFANKYEISNFGKLISYKYNTPFSMTLSVCKKKGYLYARLTKDGKCKRVSVHRLVALHFIPNPKNKEQVNHIDGNRKNNKVENLEWVSNRANCSHRSVGKINTSNYIGVYLNKKHNNWKSAISINGKKVHLGTFNSEKDAHLAYVNYLKNNNIENKYLVTSSV